MSETQSKYVINMHLKVLFNLLTYSGLLHLGFDATTEKFVQSRLRYQITQAVNIALMLYCAACPFFRSHIEFLQQLGKDVIQQEPMSRATEDHLILEAKVVHLILSTWAFAINHFLNGPSLLATFNEMIEIFKSLGIKTDFDIFCPSIFQLVFIFKYYSTVLQILLIETQVDLALGSYAAHYCQIVGDLMFWSYFCTQLILICFYAKVNEIFDTTSEHERSRTIKQLIGISFRIHRVKLSIDKFFATFYALQYLKFLTNLIDTYVILKYILVCLTCSSKEILKLLWLPFLFFGCPGLMAPLIDIYLIVKLSRMLTDLEDKFQQKLLSREIQDKIMNNWNLQKQIDVFLLKNHIRHLGKDMFRGLKVSQSVGFLRPTIVAFLLYLSLGSVAEKAKQYEEIIAQMSV